MFVEDYIPVIGQVFFIILFGGVIIYSYHTSEVFDSIILYICLIFMYFYLSYTYVYSSKCKDNYQNWFFSSKL